MGGGPSLNHGEVRGKRTWWCRGENGCTCCRGLGRGRQGLFRSVVLGPFPTSDLEESKCHAYQAKLSTTMLGAGASDTSAGRAADRMCGRSLTGCAPGLLVPNTLCPNPGRGGGGGGLSGPAPCSSGTTAGALGSEESSETQKGVYCRREVGK